ncbi:ATP-dependent zinc metalloprotease FtsH [Myxococcota bacterium]|nr:ATP-dependent zinc metalloprotease FtsH [Myxococcota bacterium]MBU1900263.1 ATP-dependent zinc metalloprotease FtsH [Myxococcota bacterium]
MSQRYKTGILWVILIVTFVVIWRAFPGADQKSGEISWDKFISDLDKNEVKSLVVDGMEIRGEYKDEKKTFLVYGPIGEKFQADLAQRASKDDSFSFRFRPEEKETFFQSLVVSWLPMLVLFIIFFIFMRQLQSGGGKAMSFGKSKAKLLNEHSKKVTFEDVAGVEEAKEELEEIIHFLRDPKRFTRLGGRIPKGVLLMGPPGTGKTLLARGVAGEAGVPFYTISGSDFVEMFVGVGASRVRDLFEQGKKNAPCIIFIDEIDAVGRHRGAGLGGGHDEREQTLNQLLVEMDGFESNDGVILIAATNRPDVLDPALLRPGRFDRRVIVSRPDVRGREQILKVHSRRVPLAEDVNHEVIARGTPGFSGADLENLVNEAALLAARHTHDVVSMSDFEEAKDKVMMGPERRSMIISEKERKTTAYHEAGHVLVAYFLPGTDPVHKVTIIPRGRALGLTKMLPTEDRLSLSKDLAEKQIAIMMGGRVAEEIIFNNITTGAGQDIEVATSTARKMVCEWGMSPKLGPLSFGKKEEQIFLGREIAQHRDFSEQTAILIDQEVRRFVMAGYEKATQILAENITLLKALGEQLLLRETLDAEEVAMVVRGEDLPPLPVAGEAPQARKPRAVFITKEKPQRLPSTPAISEA